MSGDPLERLLQLRLRLPNGRRSPHKPLLTLLALGRLLSTGSSRVTWSEVEDQLADLLAEFGPASATSRAQSAAYPFNRLRADGVWQLDADVPMDAIGPLRQSDPTGQFDPAIEGELARHPQRALATARLLALSHFPDTVVGEVLAAAGLDPELVLRSDPAGTGPDLRRRSRIWRAAVVQAWDRSCAFCGWDGQLGGAPVGLDAAHVRWFAYDGPDDLDNGLALCSLHHKLFDRGALGLDAELRVVVSSSFTARTPSGQAAYDLHGRALRPRPGTLLPRAGHVAWHTREVFQGGVLAA